MGILLALVLESLAVGTGVLLDRETSLGLTGSVITVAVLQMPAVLVMLFADAKWHYSGDQGYDASVGLMVLSLPVVIGWRVGQVTSQLLGWGVFFGTSLVWFVVYSMMFSWAQPEAVARMREIRRRKAREDQRRKESPRPGPAPPPSAEGRAWMREARSRKRSPQSAPAPPLNLTDPATRPAASRGNAQAQQFMARARCEECGHVGYDVETYALPQWYLGRCFNCGHRKEFTFPA